MVLLVLRPIPKLSAAYCDKTFGLGIDKVIG